MLYHGCVKSSSGPHFCRRYQSHTLPFLYILFSHVLSCSREAFLCTPSYDPIYMLPIIDTNANSQILWVSKQSGGSLQMRSAKHLRAPWGTLLCPRGPLMIRLPSCFIGLLIRPILHSLVFPGNRRTLKALAPALSCGSTAIFHISELKRSFVAQTSSTTETICLWTFD